jgi:hypothetical protein
MVSLLGDVTDFMTYSDVRAILRLQRYPTYVAGLLSALDNQL